MTTPPVEADLRSLFSRPEEVVQWSALEWRCFAEYRAARAAMLAADTRLGERLDTARWEVADASLSALGEWLHRDWQLRVARLLRLLPEHRDVILANFIQEDDDGPLNFLAGPVID